jgi:hypothetical protein
LHSAQAAKSVEKYNRMFKKFLPHIAAIATFILVSVVYFSPQFQGKEIRGGDVVSYLGMSKELKDFKAETGEHTLWTNSMFGGMPTYQIRTITEGNQLNVLRPALRLYIPLPAGQFITAMLCFYILMLVMGVNPWLAIIGAIGFGLTTNNLTLLEAGHESKLRALSYFPLIVAGIFLAFRGRYLWGGAVFALGLGLDLLVNHVQMTYYLALALVIYGILRAVYDIRRGEVMHFAKAAAVLLLGAGLAVGSVANNLLPTAEYAEDTMRGEPILAVEESETDPLLGQMAPRSSSEVDGLEYEYAMQWSNSLRDLWSSFIPGFVGGGSSEPISRDSEFGRALRGLGANLPQEFAAPLYWGGLPFTSGPIYFGAVMCFLFLFGALVVRGPVKWWLVSAVIFTMLLSLGRNFDPINRLLFDSLPLFNKFRTPNSILTITSFLIPILAVLGLREVVKGERTQPELTRALYISAGTTGGLALLMALIGPSFFDFGNIQDGPQLTRMTGQAASTPTVQQLISALRETRAEYLVADAWRSFGFVAAAALVLFGYLRDWFKLPVLAAGLALLTLIDLWGVDQRYVSKEDFQRQTEQAFVPTPADQQILQDPDPNFRVLNLMESTYQSARTSYFHKSVGGYHAAKLQRYQDIIDRYLSQGNAPVINMLNTKYVIGQGPDGQPVAQRNPDALGNAWFVEDIRLVPTPNAEIDALGDINPDSTAIVHEEFSDYVAGLTPTGEGSIELTSYAPNELRYRSSSPSEQLAVFSEIWYGPDKGWTATIDGAATDFIRTDYLLRGLRVPAGEHEIVFRFDPPVYHTGVTISWISSLVVLLGLLALTAWTIRGLRNNPAPVPAPTAPTPEPAAEPQPRAQKQKDKRRKKPKQ